MKVRSCWSRAGIAILAAFLLALVAQPMLAQSQYISGTVVDASGGFVPDAAVKIQDAVKGGPGRQTSTDQAGRFQAIDIEPGR